MTELTLRNAFDRDIGTVKQLYRSVIGLKGCTWNDKYPSSEDLKNDYKSGGLFVFGDRYNVIGAVSVISENEFDDIECWTINDGTHKEIARVVISSQHQGNGYSKEMLLQLFLLLLKQGCTSVHLLVSKNNPSAIKLYKSLGFHFLGECFRYEHDYFICEKILAD